MHEHGSLPEAQRLERIWRELAAGAASGRHPFHTMAVATVDRDADDLPVAEVRTVVLRAVDPVAWQLSFHTDRRSPKAIQILRSPGLSLLFYDTDGRRQIRARGYATLRSNDERSRERWEMVPERSRACYRSPLAPGAPVSRAVASPESDTQDPDAGYEVFTVVDVRLTELELLLLDHRGHVRLSWTAGGDPARPTYLNP